MAKLPTVERLAHLFSYDKETGFVTRRVAVKNHQVGSVVGYRNSSSSQRLETVVDGQKMPLARVCWALSTGQHAAGYVDHINGDASDNRLHNLRDVSPTVNNQNRRSASRRSKTGVMGVVQRGNRFRVCITFRNRTISAGSFDSHEQAHDFYLSLKRRLHDGCTL